MKRKHRIGALLLVWALLLSLTVGVFAADQAPAVAKDDIVVLYTNDVHCALGGELTYASLAAYKQAVAAITPNVALVDAGDFLQGGHMGTLSAGEFPTQIAQQLGYDFMVPGNHEFDYGMEQLLTLQETYKTPYYSCNLTNLETGKNLFPGYLLREYGDKTVGFVAISTPETLTKSSPLTFQDGKGGYRYSFGESGDTLYRNVQTAVDQARAGGADYIVAVAHLGVAGSTEKWTSEAVIANTTGIDAMLDGHSHETIESRTIQSKDGKAVVLSSTGSKLAAFGQLVIGADGMIAASLVTEFAGKDAKTDAFVQTILDQYETQIQEKVATTVALTCNDAAGQWAVRHQETNLGDLCADAYRVELGADIGVVTAGSIRADIQAGDMTYGDILSVYPYNNMCSVVEVTGQTILDMLEMAYRMAPADSGGFLHVSGMTLEVNTDVPSPVKTDEKGIFASVEGPRRVQNVLVGGQPLDPQKTYTLATHDYTLKQGGDGMSMFQNARFVQESVILDSQLLIDYIQDTLGGAVGGVYADIAGQGRIKMTGPRFSDVTDACDNTAAVAWCAEKGLMSGVTATMFEPGRAATVAEAVTVLYRLAGSPELNTTGVNWYDKAMTWATQANLTDGAQPKAPVTRAQWAQMLGNWLDTQNADHPGDLSVPIGTDANAPVTRCQMADSCMDVRTMQEKPAA